MAKPDVCGLEKAEDVENGNALPPRIKPIVRHHVMKYIMSFLVLNPDVDGKVMLEPASGICQPMDPIEWTFHCFSSPAVA